MNTDAHEMQIDKFMQDFVIFVIEKLRDEEKKALKARHDKLVSTVKLLLNRYRFIVAFAENITSELSSFEDNSDLQAVLEDVYDGCESFLSGPSSENVRARAAKARTVSDHMCRMFECYRQSTERSGKTEEMRRYRVVKALFFDEMPLTVDEVAEREHIDLRTVYRDIDSAADRLAVFLFGVFGLRFF